MNLEFLLRLSPNMVYHPEELNITKILDRALQTL